MNAKRSVTPPSPTATAASASQVLADAVPDATLATDPDDPHKITALAVSADHETIAGVLKEIDVEGPAETAAKVVVYPLVGMESRRSYYVYRFIRDAVPQANLTLRWAFVEAATDATKGDSQWSRFYHRMATRKGKSIAKVALARKMSKMIYHMLKRKIDYQTYLCGGHLGR